MTAATQSMSRARQLIRVGHSPDPDDAFMFYALANDKIDTGEFEFTHELVDIETLNRRAFGAELELTAREHPRLRLPARQVHPLHMRREHGRRLRADGRHARAALGRRSLKSLTIAVPGKLTSAYLALRLCLGTDFASVEVPFDEIIPAVVAGEYRGQKIDAGLIIHEGQLTYGDQDLKLVVDLGVWWKEKTGLPLPLGANGIRKSLGPDAIHEIQRLLYESIDYGLRHREPALSYALQYGRDLDAGRPTSSSACTSTTGRCDFGDRGREAVAEFLAQGHAAGVLPELVSSRNLPD